MNITDAVEEKLQEDKLEQIFERQKELMGKYHDIEKASGLLQTDDCPVHLDSKAGQARLKDFAWRITEEIGEALDAKVNGETEHFEEELVDGLHFLVEFSILADFTNEDIQNVTPDYLADGLEALYDFAAGYYGKAPIEERITSFIMHMGMTCNCLKNKPWKQSHMLTDKGTFYDNLIKAWYAYIGIMIVAFPSATSIARTYLKKSQVNQFRQRSNY